MKQSYLHLQFVCPVYFSITQLCCSVFEMFESFYDMEVGSAITDKYTTSLRNPVTS